MADFPFDIVGLDLDGTLLDTHQDLGAAVNHALEVGGFDPVAVEEIEGLIGGDTMGKGRSKPAPDPIFEAVERCGGGRLAFVGDSTYDVLAARNAGVPVVAAAYGYCDVPAQELGADAVIERFDELIPALEAL